MRQSVIRLAVALATFFAGVTSARLPDALFFAHDSDSPALGEAEQEVLRVERAYLRAHTERDAATLDRILADEFTLGPVFGEVTPKAPRLRLMSDPAFTFLAIDTEGVRVRVEGDTALVTGTATLTARYRNREFTSPAYGYAREYVKRDGRWQVVNVRITLPSWR